jgi:hypothetical protein
MEPEERAATLLLIPLAVRILFEEGSGLRLRCQSTARPLVADRRVF